jgi:serine/threonine-protein phosphatase 2A regulatory subunit B''
LLSFFQNPVEKEGKLLTPEEFQQAEDEAFQKLYSSSSTSLKATNTIPQFYFKLPENNLIASKLREESRTLFLQKRSRELLDNNELKTLWTILEKNYTPPLLCDEQYINYDDFLKVVGLVSEKCR